MNKNAGILNAVFDDKGVLKTNKLSNKILNLDNFKSSEEIKELIDNTIGKKIKLAEVKGSYVSKGSYFERNEDNPLHNVFADAILENGKIYGAEISLFPASSLRGGAKEKITNYDIKYTMLPFNSELRVVDLTKKRRKNKFIDDIQKLGRY